MRRENSHFIVILLSFILAINTSYTFADTGRFAILMFGGAKSGPGKAEFDDEPFVEYEIAPMFENLVDPDKYRFNNSDIFVFNLNGEDDATSYYYHFQTTPTNYFKADSSNIIDKFHSIHSELSDHDTNLVFIYMSGHQGHTPVGSTNYYNLFDYNITDTDFARWIKDELLEYNTNENGTTKIIILGGFCASWKFFTPELEDVCTYLSYAAADTENTTSSVRTSPDHSLMKYYIDEMNGTIKTFDTAFYQARSIMLEYYLDGNPPIWSVQLDDPQKEIKPSGSVWDDEWTLYGPLTSYKSGTISEDEFWFGTVYVTGDVTISNNVTVDVFEGTTIKISDDKSINVYGELNAVGASSKKITFISNLSNPQPNQYWDKIKFYDSASDNSKLEYCKIKHASTGIDIDRANITIKNCIIDSISTNGINIYKAKPVISNNEIKNCYRGIRVDRLDQISGSFEILENLIHDYCNDGIFLYLSSPGIRKNNIYENDYGITCDNSCPSLGYDENHKGENNIYENDYGLKAINYSEPFLGGWNCGDPNGGYNEFEINDDYHVYASNYSHMLAQVNWWGESPPDDNDFYTTGSSSITYNHALTSDPTQGSNIERAPEEILYNSAFASESGNESINLEEENIYDPFNYYDADWPLRIKIAYARQLYYLGEIEAAQDICKNLIKLYTDSTITIRALNILWRSSLNEQVKAGYDLDAFKAYLLNFLKDKKQNELYKMADFIQAVFEDEKGLTRLDRLINENLYTALGEQALYLKFTIYYYDLMDYENAAATLDLLKQYYPDSPYVESTDYLLNKRSGIINKNNDDLITTANNINPENYKLIGAYPNPFNPTTTIKYSLPLLSEVELRVFNILGQKVRQLSIASQPVGSHQWVWDGRNTQGDQVPSGVYIIEFRAASLENIKENFRESLKVTLLR